MNINNLIAQYKAKQERRKFMLYGVFAGIAFLLLFWGEAN